MLVIPHLNWPDESALTTLLLNDTVTDHLITTIAVAVTVPFACIIIITRCYTK